MKQLYATLIMLVAILAQAQVGVNTLVENAKAEFTVVSPGNNKGILIPRMTKTQFQNIEDPVDGLFVYSTSNNTFYYYNGTLAQWVRIGEFCTVIQDEDADTRVTVEFTADEDKVRFIASGVEIVQISTDGLEQAVGDLRVPNGTVHIGSAYSLPTIDGTSKYILRTDGNGTLSWVNPSTMPGLVAGIQTIPLGMGREFQSLDDKAYLTIIIPWSKITIYTVSVLIKKVGSPVLEIGIYSEKTLLSSGTVTPAADGFVSVTLATPVVLHPGNMYRMAIIDRQGTPTSVLEYPQTNTLNWCLQRSIDALAPPPNQHLPATIAPSSPAGSGVQKMFWFCAY
jgi:hypothetical protein